MFEFILRYMKLSSAKRRILDWTFSFMSLMYSKKSIGPRTEPCGTPDVTSVMSDRAPLTETRCLRFDRKDVIQLCVLPPDYSVPFASRGWENASVSKLACLVLPSARSCRSSICPGRLSTAWLFSLVVFFVIIMFSKWWHARSIGRLRGGWYALPTTIHFSHIADYNLWLLVFLSLYVMLCIFPFWSVRPQVWYVLVWSVSRSLDHMGEIFDKYPIAEKNRFTSCLLLIIWQQ